MDSRRANSRTWSETVDRAGTGFSRSRPTLQEQRTRRRRFWATAIPLILLTITAVLAFRNSMRKNHESNPSEAANGRCKRRSAETQRKQAQAGRLMHFERALSRLRTRAFLEARAKLRQGMELSGAQYHPFLGLWWQLDRIAQRWLIQTGQHHYHITFSRDGEKVAVSSINGSVELIDVDTGRRHLLRGHQDQVIRAAFHPKSHRLASAGLGPFVRLWDVESAQEVAALPAPKGLIRTIRFSETGRYLAALVGKSASASGIWRI